MAASKVIFESVRLSREFDQIDPRLRHIFFDLVDGAWPDCHLPARVICIHRTPAEELAVGGKSGIHVAGPPYRAIDISGKDFTQPERDAAALFVNLRWSYDPSRPSLKVCDASPHGTGPHWHLQVHPNTRTA